MTISASTPLRVVVLLTSFALALALLLIGGGGAQAADSTTSSVVVARVQHEVLTGDTLWQIAALYTDPGDDVRDTIQEIRTANALDSSAIHTGEVLVIPVEF